MYLRYWDTRNVSKTSFFIIFIDQKHHFFGGISTQQADYERSNSDRFQEFLTDFKAYRFSIDFRSISKKKKWLPSGSAVFWTTDPINKKRIKKIKKELQ